MLERNGRQMERQGPRDTGKNTDNWRNGGQLKPTERLSECTTICNVGNDLNVGWIVAEQRRW